MWAGAAEESAASLVEVFRLDEPLGDFIKRLGENMGHIAQFDLVGHHLVHLLDGLLGFLVVISIENN